MSESMGAGHSGEAMPTGPEAAFSSEPAGLAGTQGGGELMADASFGPAPTEATPVQTPTAEAPSSTGGEGAVEAASSAESLEGDIPVVHEAPAPTSAEAVEHGADGEAGEAATQAEAPPAADGAEPVHQEAAVDGGEAAPPVEAAAADGAEPPHPETASDGGEAADSGEAPTQSEGAEPVQGEPVSDAGETTASDDGSAESGAEPVHQEAASDTGEAAVSADDAAQPETAEPADQNATRSEGEAPDTQKAEAAPEQAEATEDAPKPEDAAEKKAEAPSEKAREDKEGEDWRYNFDKHKDQPSPRPALEGGVKTESHHPQSQARLSDALANYSPREHPTILAPKPEHAALTKEQMNEMRTMDRDQYAQEIGTTRGMVRANKLMTDAGIPETKAAEAILREDGYLKGTTPLSEVGETIRDYWASKGLKPP